MSARRLSKPSRIPSNRLALEPRIVFDGAMPVAAAAVAEHTAAASGDHAQAVERAPTEHTNIAHAPATTSTATPAPQRLQPPIDKGLGEPDQPVVDASADPAPAVHEIAFVDDSVKDIESYLPGFKGLVVTLSADRDGVDQIAQALAGQSGLTAIHIISHGGSGFLSLGTASLDATTIASRYAADLAQIGAALTRDGDILLYGCDVAAGPTGQSFIEQLAAATLGDVAASTDATGAARFGGNWTLEAHTGPIETQSIDPVGYDALLAAPTLFLGGAATTNYSSSYVENAQPSAIAAAADTITQTGGSGTLRSATIQITNAQASDVLTQIAPISGLITQSFYNSSTHTLTLTGTDTYANYAAAIRAIGFASASENPSGTSRTISVVVNDGTSNSNTAVTTIAVTPVNDAPVVTVVPIPNLLTDGDFENTLQPNINGNNLQGTTYGAYTATAPINIVHVDGTGYSFAPDLAESGVQYLDLAGPGSIQQTFTLATAQTVTFGGSFANREPFSVAYTAPNTSIQIFNSGGTQVGSTVTPTIPLVAASGSETWYDATGSVSLAAGTYTFRVNLGDYAQVDNLYVRPGLSNAVSYTENAAPTLIAAAATASDVDNANLTGATITLTNAASLDVLSVVGTLPTGITASSYDPATGILTLSGSATVAAYQSAIRQIGYSSTSENPSATPRTVTVTVNDGTTTSATATTTIAVIPVNDPPNAVADSFGTPHDTPYTLDVRANDSDAENDPLTVTKVNGTAVTAGGASVAVTGGQVALTTQGNLLFTPTAGFTGSTSFTYAVSDGNGGESTATVSGSVTDTAPVVDLNSGSTSTQRITNGTFTGGASGWTATGDGFAQNNVYYWSTNGSTGTLTQTGLTGLNSGYGTSGAAQLTFDLGWNNGVPDSTVPATLDLSIAGVVYARLTTSSDNANGTVGSITYLNGASGPTSSISSSAYLAWTYTNIVVNLPANVAASGALLFSYSAGTGGGDDISIDNVSVLTRTDTVAGNNYSTSYTENGAPLSIAAAGSEVRDNDGNFITAATVTLTNAQAGDVLSMIGTLPTGITASAYNAGTGVITLSGSATLAQYATAIRQIGYSSTSHNPSTVDRTINVVVNDGILSSTTSTTTISVTAVNDAPTSAAPTTVSSAEDTTLSFTGGNALSVADVDSPNLTVSLNVAHGTLTLGTTTGLTFSTGSGTANAAMTFSGTQAQLNAALASLTYRPSADYNGSDTLGFSTSDGSLSTARSVALTITPVADITADSVTTNENNAITFNAITGTNGATPDTFSDSTRAITSVTQAAHGTVSFTAAGVLTYTPNTNYSGTDTFTYTVTAGGTTETATETVTVNFVNQAPTSTAPASVTSAEDTTLSFTSGNALSVADVDSPSLTVSLNVAHGTLTLGTITGLTFTTGTGTANTAMTFSGTQAQVNAALASLTYRPAADFNGSDTLGFSTSDGALTTPRSVALTITPVADITADNVTTNENAAISFNAITGTNGATPDTFSDSTRAITSVTQAAHGTVSFTAAGVLTYTPNTNYSGTDTFTYTVTAGGTTETATETVTVNFVNQAPTSTAPASLTSAEDTTLSFTSGNALSVADVDSPSLTVSLNVAHGTLTLGTITGLTFTTGTGTANTAMTFSGTQAQVNAALASLTYRPAADFNGSDTLGFSTSDGALTTPRSVALTITPVADITADNVTTNENAAISFNAITGTNGATPDTFSDSTRAITSVTQAAHGTVSFTAAGVLTYTPNTNYSGTDTFTYTVTAGGTTETATETVTVNFVNQAPTSTAPANVTSAEDTTLSFTSGNALSVADVDSPSLTVSLNVAHGTLTLGTITGLTFTTGTGTANTAMTFSGTQAQVNAALASLTYRPAADFNGSDTLGFSTSDGALTTPRSVALTITPVADITADNVTTNENAAISFNAITGTNGATPDTFSDSTRAITSVTQAAHGTVSFTAAGVLTYTPNTNYSGTDTFTYTVTAGGTTETATETVTVNFVNQAPTSTAPASVTSAEDTTLSFTSGNALSVADVDSPSLTVSLNVAHGTLTLGTITGLTFTTGTGTANTAMTFSGTQAQVNAALASLTYRPAADFNGSDTLGFSTSDGSLSTARSVALTITPVADITADSVTTNENNAITFNAITGTNGATADTFSDSGRAVTSVTQGAHGSVTFNANGTLVYTPNTNYSGTDTFTYTVTAGGTTETATETVTVNFVNQAPTSTAPASVTSAEDTTLSFTSGNALSVADVDSPSLTVSLNVAHGTLTLGTITGLTFTTGTGTANTAMTFSGTQAQVNNALASLSFRPNADFNGSDTLTFSTSDGSLTTTRSVALTINPVADITADSVTTNENNAITFNAITGTNGATADTFSDSGRAVTSVTQGAHGSVTFNANGTLVYTPNANYSGTDTFNYTVTAGGTTETATETVTVNFVNQAPTSAAPASVTSAEDTTLSFTSGNALSVADVDSPSLTVSLNVAHGTLTLGTITGLTFTTGTGTANTAMTFSGTQAQVNSALASLTYRPGADFNGSDTLGFSTSDGSLSTARSVALTITPVADITADSVTTNENAAISFNAITGTNGATADTFSDSGRAVTSVTQGAHGSVTFNANGTLVYTPNTNYSGTDTFNYTVTAGGTTETATETVTVNFVNQAPTSTAPASVTSAEDTTLAFTSGNALSVADVDSPSLTVSLNVAHGTLTLGTITGLTFTTGTGTANTAMTFSGTQAQVNNALASLTYRPAADYNGSDTLGFSTSDGSLSTARSVALTITPVADITADSVTTNENNAITFNAITGTNGATADTFSDPGRAVTSVTQGAHGSVTFNANGTLVYTPNTNYSGTDTFTYTVTAGGTTETATETVTVNFVNQAPTSTAPASVTSAEDTTLSFTSGNALSVADVDSPSLTVSLNVAHGTLTLGTITGLTFTTGTGTANTAMTFSGTQAQVNAALASLTYRPAADFNGSDTLGFSTSDGALTTPRSVALTITPVADITADSVTTNENNAITFNAITGTNGATADTFSDSGRAVTSVTQGAHGSVTFNANGTLVYTPNTNYSGTDTFNYTVTAGGTTETATETVTVNFVNQAPTSTAPASVTSAEDTTLSFTSGNALSVADVDSPSLTVSLNIAHGTLTLGTITGLTFTTGTGTANTAMTFSGTQAQVNSALASLTYRPGADFNGSDTLGFSTSDGSLSTARSVALTITPVADITADSVTTNENNAITFNAITGTNGATADTFSDSGRAVTSVTQGAHGSVTFNADGTLVYTPNTNYSGTDTFNYTVTAGGTTETTTETVTVNFVNQAPTSTAPASVTSAEDTTLSFTSGNALSVADVDSPSLTVSLNVAHGTLTLGTITGLTFTTGTGTANTAMTFSGTQAQVNSALASLTYRPGADFNGSDTLGFSTSDGSLSTARSVALTITPVADITADSVTTNENAAISFNAITGTNGATADTFSDSGRAVTSVTQGAHGSVTFNANGTLVYTPNTNYSGTDTFNYTVTAGGTTETATETVTVNFVNQAPTSAAPASVTSAEDTTLSFTSGNALSVADVDSPSLTVSLNVAHGTLTLGTITGLTFTTGTGTANTAMTFSGTQAQVNSALASLTYRPGADFNGSDTLGFSTSDGSLSAARSVALTITPVADITADSVTTTQNAAITFNAITGTNGATADTFSDPGRAVTSVTQGAHGSVTFNADGTLVYTPNTNYSGTDTFNYTVTAGGTTETATETVTIGAVNQAPTSVAPTAVSSAEDTTVAFTSGNALSVADVDSPSLTVSLNVAHGTLTLGTTTGLTFSTGSGTANTAMTFSGTQAQVNAALASLTYRPAADFNGSDTLAFSTSDGSLSAARSVALTITPVADITADSVTTTQNAAITFNAITGTNGATADTFSDSGRAVTSVTQGAHGSVTFNANGTLVYTPNTNYSGTDTFTYTVTAGGTTETATETVTVNFVNQAPTSTAPASVTSAEDTTLSFTSGNALSVADVDSPSLTVSLNVAHGTLTLGTTTGLTFSTGSGTANTAMTFSGTQAQVNAALASLTYRPAADFNGSDTLAFSTSDGSLSAARSVALTITPVADITADSVTTTQNAAITFNAITGTNGATADTFSDSGRAVTSVTQGAHGSVTFNANGTLVYTPNTNYSGTDTFTYTVTAGGTTETATETVTVNFVNQAPTSTAPASVTSAEDTTLSFTSGNALSVADVDSPSLTVSLNVAHGTLTLGTITGLTFTTGTGTANTAMTFSGTQAQVNAALASLTYRPAADFNGSDTLGFSTSDGALNTARSVALTITPVADITADSVTTNENNAITFNAITGTNGATADTFSDSGRAVTSVTQGAHGSVTFNANGTLVYTPNTNYSGTDTFNYTVTAGGTTETATETVTVNFVNQAPTSTAPASVTSAEDTTLSFTSGNALSVADVDSPNLTVSLNVAHGTLTLGTITGLTFTTGTGTANTAMTFSGTQAQVNNALASLSFRPNADFNGSDTLTFSTSDGSLTTTRSVALTITPVADITADSVTTNENNAITFNAITGTNGATPDTFSDSGRAVTSVTQGAHGSVTFNANGTLVYTPNTNYSGTDTFTYTVTAGGTTETATETVTVNFVNQAPTSTAPASVTSAEDTTLSFTSGNALSVADVDSPSLTVSLNVAHGTLTLGTITGLTFTTGTGTANTAMTFSGTQAQVNNALASLSFRPNADFNGSDTLTFSTSDGSLTTTRSVALTITPVADITADSVTTNENNAITFNAITGTNGATADTFSDSGRAVTSVTQGAHGTVTFNANGTLVYTPNTNYSGTDTFTYTVTAGGTTETATETVTVNFVNQAPTSTAPASVTSAEDTTLSFTSGNALSVADVDSPNLTVSLNVAHGTLTLGTITGLTFTTGTGTANTAMTFSGTQAQVNNALASLSFRPNADFNGSDTLTFSTSDGSLTTTRSVALTINPVADITADSVTTNENNAITFNAITGTNGATADTFSDSGRAVTSVTQGAHGSVTFNANGTLVYTPNANYSGTDTFNYTVTAGGTTETAAETVTVNFVNQAPTSAAPASVTSAEDTTLSFTSGNALSVADVDSPSLTVSLNVAHGTLTLGTITGLTFTTGTGTANTAMTFSGTQAQVNSALASLTYRPGADFNGSDTLGFSTSDGSLSTARSVALTITPVADITADSVTTNENNAITFNAITGTNGATADTFSDSGRAVTSVTQGAHGSVTFNADGTLVYTPNTNYSGTDTFNYTVTAGGTTETTTETVTVNFVNQAPTSTAPASVTSAEDTTVNFGGTNGLTVGDVESPTLTVTLSVAHGTLTLGTTTGLTFTTGTGTADTAMTFSGTQAQLNNALTTLSFRPNPDYNGSDVLAFSTNDGSLTTTRSVALMITPVADITADSITTNQNTAISFNAITGTNGATADTFSDPGRAVTSVTQGLHGTVTFTAAGVLTYTPDAAFYGSDSYSYTVTAGGTTETAPVTMTVVHVNQVPMANNDSFTVAEDATATINVRANDTDADNNPLTVTQVNGQAITAGGAGIAVTGGTVTLGTGGSLVYTPTAYYRGSTTFTYTVSDPFGGTSTATVSGTITPVNHAPVTTNDSATIDEDHGTSGNVLINDSDPDGDPLTVASVNGNAANLGAAVGGSNGGLFTIQPNGSYTFATNGQFDDLGAGQSRTTSVSYAAADGQGGTSTATITITVTGVDDAPVANADSFDTTDTSGSPTGLPLSNNVLTNDTDADHDTPTVTAVNGSGAQVGALTPGSYGTLTLNANGTFTYAVDRTNIAVLALLRGQAPLTDQFTYTESDGHGGTASTTLTIRVYGTSDGPMAGNDGNAILQGQASASGNVITGLRTDGSGTTTTVPTAVDTDPGFTLNVDEIRLPAETSGSSVTPSATGSRTGQYGTITIDANGNYSYALNNGSATVLALVPGQVVTDSFVYSITDGLHTTEATISISINGRNDPPVAQNDSFVTAQGTAATINVRANDSDPDNDPIRVTAVNGTTLTAGGAGVTVTGGVVALNTAGDLVYTPNANYRGSPSFTYTIEDPSGAAATATVGGTVTPVNHAPTAVADVFGTLENNATTINVVANDSDVDGDPIAVTQINGNAVTAGGPGIVVNGGVVTLTASGSLLFTPDTNFAGSVSFGYTLADTSGATGSAAVSGTVTHVNQPPVAVADQFTSAQNTTATINVRANDSDPDGDAIIVTQVNGTAITAGGAAVAVTGGTVVLDAAGNLEFTPTGNYRGPTSFSYTVGDPFGATGSATVSGTVTPFNHPPVAAPESFSVAQGSVATINALADATDPDGDPLTITQVNGLPITAGGADIAVTGGTVRLDGAGNLVFTPTPGYLGATSFSYTLADPSGATSSASVSGTVSPAANHPPVANADSYTIAANTPTTIDVRANDTDADSDPLTVTRINGTAIVFGGPAIAVTGGTLALDNAGRLVFTPTTNYAGPLSFTYTVSDPSGATSSASVSGTVSSAANHPPVANADSYTIAANTPTTIDVRANDTDADSDPLTVTRINGTAIVFGGPAIAVTGGTLALDNAGRLVFTPTTNYAGPLSFTYTVSDPSGATSSASVSGTVSSVPNHPPVANADSYTIAANTPTTIDVRANDTDADSDPLTVTRINGTAIVFGGPAIAVTGGTLALDNAGRLVFTPTTNYAGPLSFTYTVSDPSGTTSSASVSGTVSSAANHPPVANADSFVVAEDTSVTIDVRANDTDADNDPLTVTRINGSTIVAGGAGVAVTGGVVTLNGAGNVVFTPTANYNGPTAFTYTVADPSGATSTASVGGTVAPVADAPIVRPDSATTLPNTVVTIDVLANDSGVDGPLNPASVQLTGTANPGDPLIVAGQGTYTINPTSGAITFTPLPGFRGTPAVGYTVADTFGSRSAPVLLSVTVGGPDRAPVAVADAFTTSANGATTIDVRANDSDADGDPLTVTRINGTAITAGGAGVAVSGGVVTLNAAGNLVFTPTANTSGAVSFSYTVADPLGATSTATVSVTVTPLNGTPTAVADTVSGEIGVPLSIDVLANDLDSAGNRLTIVAIDGHAIVAGGPGVAVAGGVVTLGASGKLLFTPAAGSSLTQVSFSYTASDPSGLQSTAGVTLNLATGRLPDLGPATLPATSSPLAGGASLTPSPSLVLQSVDDARGEQVLYGSFATLPSDGPTAAEIVAGARSDATFAPVDATSGIGLIGRDANLFREGIMRYAETLFVQHAVRYEALADAHALYVQTAVQQTQAEALAIQLRAAGTNSAIVGSTTLLDPFSIGAPAIVVPTANESVPTRPSAEGKRTEADRDVREDVVSIDALTIATGRSPSARGFSVQLKDSAKRLHVGRVSADRRSPVVVVRDQNVVPSAPDTARR